MNYLKFSTKSQTIHMFILLIPNVDINKLIKRSLNANKDYHFLLCYTNAWKWCFMTKVFNFNLERSQSLSVFALSTWLWQQKIASPGTAQAVAHVLITIIYLIQWEDLQKKLFLILIVSSWFSLEWMLSNGDVGACFLCYHWNNSW